MRRWTTTMLVTFLAAAPLAAARGRWAPPQRGQLANVRYGRQPYGAPIHEPFKPPMTARKIRTAIDDGCMFLRSRQLPDGQIGTYHTGGSTVLGTLALLAAGANPASDDTVRKAMKWLAKLEVNNTYVRAIRANVWEYALRRIPHDKGVRAALKKDYEWLLAALGDREGWRYRLESRDWDNSCTQYGVLGIWAATRAGLQPGDGLWQRMSKHFRSCQNPDGGWGYQRGGSTANMATAGLASMFLVFDMYHGKSYYTAKNPRTFTTGEAKAVLDSIQRGMTWLGATRQNKADGYYLYGIERTGVASGRKYIGGEDWFRNGALTVLQRQGPYGEIARIGGHGEAIVKTSFCVLFLVYGGAPVAFNKLQYGTGQDWNLNPRDLANLTKHLWSAYERPLNWHSVSIRAKASELEAPILVLAGSQAAKFTEPEVLQLREYIERGGTILAEPSDHSEAFEKSMAALVQLMYPQHEYPTCRLQPLAADHGLYTVLRQKWSRRPKLLGVTNGSRTFFFFSKEYMSADWQMNRTDSDAFRLAMNLLFYATDLAPLKGKYASILPETPPAKARDGVAVIARVRHRGATDRPNEWHAGKYCWEVFAPYLRHVAGYKLEERPAVRLGKDKLDGIRFLHITGRRELKLSPAERAALKKYVEAGGTVLVDAYAGSESFAASARREIEGLFGKLRALEPTSTLAAGRFLGGADLSRRIRLKLPARRWLREHNLSPSGQKLEVVEVGGRPAVLFSRFDLTGAIAGVHCYRSVGYQPDSARRIAANIMAYAMAD